MSSVQHICESLGIILKDGHFAYTSGRHGACYVNKDALYPHTTQVQEVCRAMAQPFVGQSIDTVAGPTMGGVVLSQWVAAALSEAEQRPVLACFAEERSNDAGEKERYFGRGYPSLIEGKRVLVVEDILTTGGSVRQVVETVRQYGGDPIAVSALCNRGAVTEAMIGNVPLHAAITVNFESWEPENCPLCKSAIPINTTVGKGATLPNK